MKIISAKKENKIYYGNMKQVADLIGVNPETVRRWNRSDKEIVYKNGYEINLNTEKL